MNMRNNVTICGIVSLLILGERIRKIKVSYNHIFKSIAMLIMYILRNLCISFFCVV